MRAVITVLVPGTRSSGWVRLLPWLAIQSMSP